MDETIEEKEQLNEKMMDAALRALERVVKEKKEQQIITNKG